MSDGCIFNFSNPKWQYKGVFSAILDNDAVCVEMGEPRRMNPKYIAELIGFVWVDEDGMWHFKARIKFPSGTKQSFEGKLGKDSSEAEAVKAFSKMPLKDTYWFPNPDGTVSGLIDVMQANDLIESIQRQQI